MLAWVCRYLRLSRLTMSAAAYLVAFPGEFIEDLSPRFLRDRRYLSAFDRVARKAGSSSAFPRHALANMCGFNL